MRVLLLLQHAGQAARLEPLVAALSQLGHESVVMLEHAKRPGVKDGEELVMEAARASSRVRHVSLPAGRGGPAATRLAGRIAARLPGAGRIAVRRIAGEVAALEADLVLTSPPADRGSASRLVERAARRLGLAHAVLADAWDDLLARPLGPRPHALYVWNEAQARAATGRDGLAPGRVVVTGAPSFDHLLGWEQATGRAAFCAVRGLDAERPFHVLVVGAELLAGAGLRQVFERARALRHAGGVEQLLVRAHDVDRLKPLLSAPRPPADLAGSLVWSAYDPAQSPTEARADYLDALHHAAGVLSADAPPLLVAALLGRPAHLLAGEGAALEAATGGAVRRVAEDGALPPCAPGRERLLALVRPRGHDESVAPVLAMELATLAANAARRRPRMRRVRAGAATRGPTAQTLPSFRSRMDAELDLLRFNLREATRGDGPLLAGPFSTEVGFELLYWIPFLRWAVDEVPELRERLVVVSRGGTGAWSADTAARYADLYDVCHPTEILERRDSQKQRGPTRLDLELLERLRVRLGLDAAAPLHPSLFFNFYYRVMKCDQRSFARGVILGAGGVAGLAARYRPIEAPPHDGLDDLLPDSFVAVRFYSRPSLPDTPENRRFIGETIGRLARSRSVVLLNNGMELDEHVDFDAPDEAVTTIDHLMEPSTNLRLQTAVLARARAFVGTYGGLAYLAPHLGVPALAFSSLPEHTHPFHLDLAQRIFDGPGFGSLVTLRPTDLELLELLVGGLPAPR